MGMMQYDKWFGKFGSESFQWKINKRKTPFPLQPPSGTEPVQVWQKWWHVRREGWGEDWDEGKLAVVQWFRVGIKLWQTLMKMDKPVRISVPSYFVISFCYAFIYKSVCSLRISIHCRGCSWCKSNVRKWVGSFFKHSYANYFPFHETSS